MTITRFFTITISLFLLNTAVSAQELGVQFMDESIRTGYSNPGQMREHFISIGLPAHYQNYGYNGPHLGTFLSKDANGIFTIDVDAALAKMKDTNFIRSEIGFETFNFDLNFGRVQIGLAHSARFIGAVEFPRELPEMAFNGNAQYIDQNIEVGPSLNATLYGELAIGTTFQINDKLSIGSRLKYLSGLGNISSDKHSVNIYTDPEYYQITATTDYEMNVAGSIYTVEAQTQADSSYINFEFESMPFGQFFGGGNNGLALDLGAVYEVNDKLTLGASVIDMGSIWWNKRSSNFKSQGSYTFEGIDASGALFGDDSLNFEPVLDTIAQILGVTTTNESYASPLPTRFFVNGSYEIIESLEVGATLHGEMLHDKFRPAFALSVQKEFGKWFNIGAIVGYRNKRIDNIGLNFSAQLGPVQIYGASDNIPSVFVPYKNRNTNFRVGLNLLFGKKGEAKD